MLDLSDDHNLNTMSLKEMDEIWAPKVVFFNTYKKLETENDAKAYATVKKKGDYERNSNSEILRANFFKGAENPIVLARVYTTEFLCNFDMSIYPFDSQKCSAVFVMKGNTGNFVRLTGDTAKYLGPTDLQEYTIFNVTILQKQLSPTLEAVEVVILFRRRILSALLSYYFPTFLICIIAYSTNFYNPSYFEAIVTVNLTALLCLTTIFINVATSLPTTSYVKMIDVWFIFCMIFPSLEVVLHV